MTNPFRDLGLPVTAELTDDEVRAAWRRAAAATHPDREDGGEPPAFAAAAAAYSALRTHSGRREALADMHERAHGRLIPGPVLSRIRPARLALRVLAVAAASWLAVAAVGWQPASAAVIAGALTWLVRTARSDLA